MGVGDISAGPGDAWDSGDMAIVDDGRKSGRECDTGMVGRRAWAERDASTEPRRDRVGVSDGTRGEHGACDVHREGSERADGLRGDGVGVGDISAVPDDAWGSGDTTGGNDGRGTGRECDTGLFIFFVAFEFDVLVQSREYWCLESYCVWFEHGSDGFYGSSSHWAYLV